MTGNAWAQSLGFLVLLLGLAWPLGLYMARVYSGESRLMNRLLGPLERLIFEFCTEFS